jgi:hypothetical protein
MPSFFRIGVSFLLSLMLLAPEVSAVPARGSAGGADDDAVLIPTTVSAPAVVPAVYRPGDGTSTMTVAQRSRVRYHRRSKRHRVAIIGGSTVGGAVVGALVGGKKGAVVGGLVGGSAGAIYDHKTHRRRIRRARS